MATHGTLKFTNIDDKKSVWLHAYSDGHPEDAYELLKLLPTVFVDRIVLSKEKKDPKLGKGWFLDQWSENN